MGRLAIFEADDINIKFVNGIDISQALMRELRVTIVILSILLDDYIFYWGCF
jgi:hypothetical protein